ncbi:xylem serine protein 1-like [Dorcoceras hygrometricum]|uniref:Xylem serine protein 1-like n=1 Tax=Dorcoceras hygrometricum TaxID=472368 RepID=A0A2Z7B8C3_9LAMI|nr:xylem serine protein 1-like [Dorcoceras hygrometricum]
MPMSKIVVLFTLFHVVCLHSGIMLGNADGGGARKPYIVYMGELPEDRSSASLSGIHHTLLSDVIGDEIIAKNSKIHSYGRSFNGFVARLLPHEAELLSGKEGIVSVFPSKKRKLLTTRSWDFIGMPVNVRRNLQSESNIIIGLLDTGVWPDSPSFNDEGFGPPPAKWNGKCVKGVNFTGCNNKLIGAQPFDLANSVPQNETTPLDTDGHGTHTASTAAGISVKHASLYGIAKGTARGGAPSARIASYKVCWGSGCEDMDILAAYDAAIADGVDVVSVSLGGITLNYLEDSVAIGSFHAMEKGILTVCAGGNSGPYLWTVQNVAPWILTVAASSIDRKFVTDVKLGNGKMLTGTSLNTFSPKKRLYPLINGARARNTSSSVTGNYSACDYETLLASKVKGKIVYCQGSGGNVVVDALGAIGTIMSDDTFEDTMFINDDPLSYVSTKDGLKIDKYINSTRSPQGVIYKSRTTKTTAPFVASFSSRGPQDLSHHILKRYENRQIQHNIRNFNGLPSCFGSAAYVKSFRPKWSPAAIKSALMTTAKAMKGTPLGAELSSGSGNVNPTAALHPGLIYDIDTEAYISFLCKEGYNNSAISLITGNKKYNCANVPRGKGDDGLNYPSVYMQLKKNQTDISAVFYRTVTNVGDRKTVYKAKVESPKGLSITVIPDILKFDENNEKKAFKVSLRGRFLDNETWYLSGSLEWSDSKHNVRSPILVYRETNN